MTREDDDIRPILIAFERSLPSTITPFDEGGRYDIDAEEGTHHRNPVRMAWVNDQIARMEK